MKINKEGYAIIAISFTLLLALGAALFLFTPLWLASLLTFGLAVLFFFILIFFREPSRPQLTDNNLVYAPADGKVVVVERVYEKEFMAQECIQVSVFMSLTNVHINWYPIGGTVEYFKYHPGKYMVAWHPKSSEDNERTTVVVGNGRCRILFRQIAGLMARRIVSYAEAGRKVEQNEKCGFIKFGSRVDVMLPVDAEILVNIGDKVTGSQTPIARLP